jgi:Ribosomal protein S7e
MSGVTRLTRELEKKFSDRHVVFVAQRRMLRKPTRTSRVKQKRPRSRTLTNVHEKILEDLVFPTEIVGKRTRVAVDGSKLLKVCVSLQVFQLLRQRVDIRTAYLTRRMQHHWSISSIRSRRCIAALRGKMLYLSSQWLHRSELCNDYGLTTK